MSLPLLVKVTIFFTMVPVKFTLNQFQSVCLFAHLRSIPLLQLFSSSFPPFTPFSPIRIGVVISRDGGLLLQGRGALALQDDSQRRQSDGDQRRPRLIPQAGTRDGS